MLEWMLLGNKKNLSVVIDKGLNVSTDYFDVAQGIQFQVDRTSNTPTPDMRRQVVFDSDASRSTPCSRTCIVQRRMDDCCPGS
jgi:hypothetical protein